MQKFLPLLLISALASAMIACAESPAGVENDVSTLALSAWDEKVTGGGEAVAQGAPLFVTVSATDDGGDARGQVTYNFAPLNRDWHGTVECVTVFDSPVSAVVAGPISANGDSSLPDEEWFVLAVLEGGEGSGDALRFRVLSMADASSACLVEETSFPAPVVDGNFNIREK